jgi:hypothetical protein
MGKFSCEDYLRTVSLAENRLRGLQENRERRLFGAEAHVDLAGTNGTTERSA